MVADTLGPLKNIEAEAGSFFIVGLAGGRGDWDGDAATAAAVAAPADEVDIGTGGACPNWLSMFDDFLLTERSDVLCLRAFCKSILEPSAKKFNPPAPPPTTVEGLAVNSSRDFRLSLSLDKIVNLYRCFVSV